MHLTKIQEESANEVKQFYS